MLPLFDTLHSYLNTTGDYYNIFKQASFLKDEMLLYPTSGDDCDLGGYNSVNNYSQFPYMYFTNNILQINFPNMDQYYSLHVFNLMGREVFFSSLENENNFNMQSLSSGIYLAVIQKNNVNIYSRKFLITN